MTNTSEPTQTYPKNNNTFLLLQIILQRRNKKRFFSPHIKKGGIIGDEILEMLRQAAEIKNFLGQIN
jgi:hypothetical protein